MAKADFGLNEYSEDKDVRTLLDALKTVLARHGIMETIAIVASVLAPFKRNDFERSYQLKETGTKKVKVPAALTGKSGPHLGYVEGIEHASFWEHQGQITYLTSEPYSISKDDLKSLIEHCDEHDIDFRLDGDTIYYPGRTFRIIFWKEGITHPEIIE
jgi:hypothetical protein